MNWIVSVRITDTTDESSQTFTEHISAANQISAAQAMLAATPFSVGANSTLTVFVSNSALEETEDTDDGPEIIVDICRDGPPPSRESVLARADEKDDPGWKDWWRNEATKYKPEAEGGGLTDEAKAAEAEEQRQWLERNRTSR